MRRHGERTRYLLKFYRARAQEGRIRFEHALTTELNRSGFELSPSLIPTKQGETYLKVGEFPGSVSGAYYAAIFSFLEGESRYNWNGPLCTDEELAHAAAALASYHNAISGWKGTGWKEPRGIALLSRMPEKWRTYASGAGDTSFDACFLKHHAELLRALTRVLDKSVYDAMPHMAIHGDYHAGNLKFQDGKVTGLFDFDWSRMDARIFDVAVSMLYFCTAWEGASDDDLMHRRMACFSEAYQRAVGGTKGISPLNRLERQYLPAMIHIATLCMIDWIIAEFYSLRSDPETYASHLRRGVRLIREMKGETSLLFRV